MSTTHSPQIEKHPATKILNRIRHLEARESCRLKAAVCLYVTEHFSADEDAVDFFNSLARHGCISGLVHGLISYHDTHSFFDRYYDEIEELRLELEDAFGESILIKGDLKNFFAWLAFEETAYRLASEIGIDL